jgi:DNA polymerase
MRELVAQVKTCQLCRLAKTRTNAVPGDGSPTAEVMFVGEGPGYHEDRQGLPFVGAAGSFLNELLSIAGLSRPEVYIANVVKCRPPNNRDPEPDEIAACAPYLERQIALINPRVIVTLGRYSMAKFFPGERISKIHGTARVVDGRLCVAMYHPAAGLHQASLADVIRSDFRKLPLYIEQARKMLAPSPAQVAERLVEAESAREFVVHDPDTAEVIEHPTVPPTVMQGAAQDEPVPAAPTTDAPEPAPAPQPPAAAPRKRKPAKQQQEEYTQLSLFDI